MRQVPIIREVEVPEAVVGKKRERIAVGKTAGIGLGYADQRIFTFKCYEIFLRSSGTES